MKRWCAATVALLLLIPATTWASQGLRGFPLPPDQGNGLLLQRVAQPAVPFDRIGRKFAFLGHEDGSFEAWAFPLKLVRAFRFSFLLPGTTVPVLAKQLVRTVEVTPTVTTLTYVHPLFTARLKFVVPTDVAGGLILVNVDALKPLSLICSFRPVLQPMWPAGLGGQYAWWNEDMQAYVISEPTGKNHALVGAPGARRISSTPAHTLSEAPHEFKLAIDNPEAVRGHWFPIVLAGGKGSFEAVKATYQKLANDPVACLEKRQAEVTALLDSTLHLDSPDTALNQALEWAKVSLDNLLVTNPDLGTGLVAGWGVSGTGGRPGFGWFFGGDACINSFSLTGLGHWRAVQKALSFLRRWQRDDGKIPHEISQAAGYLDWFGAYPYAFLHADTTPFYLVALAEYVKQAGDTAYARVAWPSARKAYRWCLSTDRNGDGFMDNRAAGLGALEYGSLTGIQTDVYLAAVWIRAVEAVAYLATLLGDRELAQQAERRAKQLSEAFDRLFWNPRTRQYAYAFNSNGQLVDEVTPWSAVAALWRLGTLEKRLASLRRMARADLATDWGVRMLSSHSARYEPLNYNYGAVWPFLTGWVATADFRNGLTWAGLQNLGATVALVYENALGHVNEVFSGATHIWPEASVPHQGFSTTGYVLPVLWGLLGLEFDAPVRHLRFAPAFPANWRQVRLRNLRIGHARLDFNITRQRGLLQLTVRGEDAEGYQLEFAPLLGPGTRVQQVRVNRDIRKSKVFEQPRFTQPTVVWRLTGSDTVTIHFRPTVEVLPPKTTSHLGDRPHGVRVVDVHRRGDTLVVCLEGRHGESARIPLVNVDLLQHVKGGTLAADTLCVVFPAGGTGFVAQTVQFVLKE